MIDRDGLRRATVFAVLFGGAIGVLAWLSGGLRATPARVEETERTPGSVEVGPTAPLAQNISVGGSEDGSLTRDAVKVVDGRPRRYRAWSAAWAKSTPRAGPDPEVSIQDVEGPSVVLHPEPENEQASPGAENAAGTTRITAKSGVIQHREDVRTDVRLTGDVAMDRLDPQGGDLRLRAPSLDLALEVHGTATRRRAHTAERVTIDGAKAHLEGTGMDGDLEGSDCRVTLLSDVKGRFLSRAGAFTATGAAATARDAPVDVTCSGACELVALETRPRMADRRWRATFHDDVRVVQGDDTLECRKLEIEFRMGDSGPKGALPAERIVATGAVRAHGRTETRTFDVTAEEASRTIEGSVGNETDVVVFKGSPVMTVHGPLGRLPGAGPAAADKAAGRLEIRCDGPATMRTRRVTGVQKSPHRTNVVFEKNVHARHWDDPAKPDVVTAELRAPKATLYGTRLESQAFQPDTLTAEGGVDLRRHDFTSHSDAATWQRMAEQGIDRYLLAGNPSVVSEGVNALRPFGKARATRSGRLLVDAADTLRIDVYGEPPAPPPAGSPPRPYAMLSGGPRVVARQLEGETEVFRLTAAQQVEVRIAADRQLEQAKAEGGAHLSGLDDAGRRNDVYGTRLVVDREVLPPGAPKDAPRRSQVTAVGDETAPAVAIVREADGRRHDMRAEMLHYEEQGALLTARRNVVATLDVIGPEEKEPSGIPRYVEGPVKVTGGEARIELEAAHPDGQGRRGLRRITVEDHVVLDGKLNRVTGDKVVYDAETGIAEVTGRPSRLVSLMESERYTSFVTSGLIRAYFDVTGQGRDRKEGAKVGGQLLRASCPNGGMIVRYMDPPDATGIPAAGTVPRRLQIESDGPIEITRTEATAVGDVRCGVQHLDTKSGHWQQQFLLYCSSARLTFDADAPGPAKDRVRTFEARGKPDYPVRVDGPDFTGRASHAQIDAKTTVLRLSSEGDSRVHVTEKATGRQVLFRSGIYDWANKEWRDQIEWTEVGR